MGGIDYVPEKFTFKVKKYDYSTDDCCIQHNDDEDNKNERY